MPPENTNSQYNTITNCYKTTSWASTHAGPANWNLHLGSRFCANMFQKCRKLLLRELQFSKFSGGAYPTVWCNIKSLPFRISATHPEAILEGRSRRVQFGSSHWLCHETERKPKEEKRGKHLAKHLCCNLKYSLSIQSLNIVNEQFYLHRSKLYQSKLVADRRKQTILGYIPTDKRTTNMFIHRDCYSIFS